MNDEDLERKKELLKYNRERFNLFFQLILHVDAKSGRFLSLILVTESILITFIPFLVTRIDTIEFLFLKLIIIILLIFTSVLLGYGSYILLRGLKPTQALLPELPLESPSLKELFWKEYSSINEFIYQNDSTLNSKTESLYLSIKLIKLTILFLCMILILFFLYYIYTLFV
jgi:hypothetical protein